MSDLPVDPQGSEPKSFWQLMDEAAGGAGGGTVCEIEIAFGYKAWPKKEVYDHPQWDSFWSYQLGNKESMKKAQGKANKFVVEHGLSSNPSVVFAIKMFKDTVLNGKKEWKDDIAKFIFANSAFYTSVIAPHMKEAGVDHLGRMWAKVSWLADKGSKPKMEPKLDADDNPIVDENGEVVLEPKYPLLPYVVEVYSSREDAMEKNGIAVVESDELLSEPEFVPGDTVPEGYDRQTWEATKAEIVKEFGRGVQADKLAADYGLPVETITLIIT